MNRTETQISRIFFFCFFNNKLTLEEEKNRIDHTKQQAHTTDKKKSKESKSKMNVFSRYTLYLVQGGKSAHMML